MGLMIQLKLVENLLQVVTTLLHGQLIGPLQKVVQLHLI